MPVGTERKVRVPAEVEALLKQLLVTYKAVMLYPPSSNIPRENGDMVAEQLKQIVATRPEVTLVVAKDQLLFEDAVVFPGQPAFSALAQEFYNRGVADMRFHAGASGQDFVAFLSLLRVSPAEIASGGGFETRLWDQIVDTITVTDARLQVRDEIALEPLEDRVEAAEVERVLEDHLAGKPIERRVLVRVVGNSSAVGTYLRQQLAGAGGGEGLDAVRLKELAHIAAEQAASERSALFAAIAEAIDSLDPPAKRALLIDYALPEARTDDALATIVRRVDVDEVCRMLVEGLGASSTSRDGFVRAVRTLAMISASDRSDVLNAAGAAMRGAGMSDPDVGEVLEAASPTRLTISAGAAAPREEKDAEAIFGLMDLAPLKQWGSEGDPALQALEREARQGATDGDIVATLVALATVAPDSDRWAAVMSVLEDSLELLVARGEFDVASDAAQAFRIASANEAFSPVQRNRLKDAIGLLTRPDDVRALTKALRVFEPDSDAHLAALRLLGLLGDSAIDPLFVLLADEPDMSTRKSLVELLSELAGHHVDRVVSHLSDPRWYVVRNVVTVLRATKDPSVVHHLSRTLRHPDPRVRRESIRALVGITDRAASNLLVSALTDEDAQNVQLAARYLGLARVQGAVPALMQVARGEGKGNRDIAPRVEAVEALGRMGSPEALAVVSDLAAKRVLKGQPREVRAAAESAMAQTVTVGGVS